MFFEDEYRSLNDLNNRVPIRVPRKGGIGHSCNVRLHVTRGDLCGSGSLLRTDSEYLGCDVLVQIILIPVVSLNPKPLT